MTTIGSQLKFIFFLPALLLITLMQSCAFHSGAITGSVAISDANFTLIGTASGTAKTLHILFIGGLGKDAIVLEAKRNMYHTYPLNSGQVFANITVDFKRGYYIVYNKTVCTVTADIIDFNKQPVKKNFVSKKHVEVIKRTDHKTMTTNTMKQEINNLQGSWRLVSLGDSEIINNAKTLTLKINSQDLKLSGYGGCNRYFGSFSINENSISIGAIGATRMACIDENIENEYFKSLGSQNFIVNRNASTLTLENDKNRLSFKLIEEK